MKRLPLTLTWAEEAFAAVVLAPSRVLPAIRLSAVSSLASMPSAVVPVIVLPTKALRTVRSGWQPLYRHQFDWSVPM